MRPRNTARVGQFVPHLEAETSHKNHLCLFGGGGGSPRFPRSNPARLVPHTCLPPAHGLGAARSSHASPQTEVPSGTKECGFILQPEKTTSCQPAERDHRAGSLKGNPSGLRANTPFRRPVFPSAFGLTLFPHSCHGFCCSFVAAQTAPAPCVSQVK